MLTNPTSDQCMTVDDETADAEISRISVAQPSTSCNSGSMPFLSDEQLISACLAGSEQAWSALVDKYRRLIYSVPIKFGFSHDDAAEVFQEVCLRLLSELKRLREPRTLPAWLLKVTANECSLFAKQRSKYLPYDIDLFQQSTELQSAALEQAEREERLRQALLQLSPRCRQLIEMLFFTSPALPYEEVSRRLSVAKGSIGFIRMRCIDKVRKILEENAMPSAEVVASKAS